MMVKMAEPRGGAREAKDVYRSREDPEVGISELHTS